MCTLCLHIFYYLEVAKMRIISLPYLFLEILYGSQTVLFIATIISLFSRVEYTHYNLANVMFNDNVHDFLLVRFQIDCWCRLIGEELYICSCYISEMIILLFMPLDVKAAIHV